MPQDRLFQMDMLRAHWRRRLSELFGQETFEDDRFLSLTGLFSRFGPPICPAGLSAETDSPHVDLIQRLSAGINIYIDSGKVPLEFTVYC